MDAKCWAVEDSCKVDFMLI